MSNYQEELPECLLCLEVFEVDDLSFFPCTCGYQICRFCWHRIRTNESGLCPACRKPYPEDPAQFKPLTDDEVHNIKKDRRQKETQRKQKSAENRKHLSNVRVVQKNLVFVVGLSQRLADPDVLRRNEYFGKFGKIHKVVINQSTSYIGSQGPSASAYVTYLRPEDALNAIEVVNNLQIDNRTLKASLGTTKYCSHFLKGTQCTKQECMYLHDLGDEAASFSKEDIQQGKHLQYEQKLVEQYSIPDSSKLQNNGKSKNPSLNTNDQQQISPIISNHIPSLSHSPPNTNNHNNRNIDQNKSNSSNNRSNQRKSPNELNDGNKVKDKDQISSSSLENVQNTNNNCKNLDLNHIQDSTNMSKPIDIVKNDIGSLSSLIDSVDAGSVSEINENGCLFGSSIEPSRDEISPDPALTNDFTNGIENIDSDPTDDDFGFDPWDICSKGLADMMEREKILLQKSSPQPLQNLQQPSSSTLLQNNQNQNSNHHNNHLQSNSFSGTNSMLGGMYFSQLPSPGSFLSLHQSQQQNLWQANNSYNGNQKLNSNLYTDLQQTSKLLNLISPCQSNGPENEEDLSLKNESRPGDGYNMQGWQEGLKALLPNINISFSHLPSSPSINNNNVLRRTPYSNNSLHQLNSFNSYKDQNSSEWFNNSSNINGLQSITSDPAIISTGVITDGTSLGQWQEPLNDLLLNNQVTQHLNFNMHASNQHQSQQNVTNNSVLMNGIDQLWIQQPLYSRYPPPGFSRQHHNNDIVPPTEQRLPAL